MHDVTYIQLFLRVAG